MARPRLPVPVGAGGGTAAVGTVVWAALVSALRDIGGRRWVHLALVASTALIVYANGIRAPFTFDDQRCIVDNPAIRTFDSFLAPATVARLPAIHQCAFSTRFLGHLTFAVNYRLGGLDPAGYHLFNVAVHVANAHLVYLLVSLAFASPLFANARAGRQGREGNGRLVALFAALLFAAHPVQTQAVTYVTQRFASLATLFYLLAAALYTASRLADARARTVLLYAGAIASSALAMATKEISFTLPFALALLETVLFRGPPGRRLLGLLPFFLMLLIPLALHGVLGHGSLAEADAALLAAGRSPLTRWEYLLTELRVVVTYLRLFVLPVGQNVDWDYPEYRSLLDPPVLLSLAFLLAVLAGAAILLVRSRRPGGSPELALASLGILWFLGTLTVESGAVPLTDVIFEHRMYLPSVGLCIAASALAFLGRDGLEQRAPAAARLVVPALVAVVLALGAATFARNGVWADRVLLWEDAASKSPRKVRPRMELGALYAASGRLDDAAREIEQAIALAPGYAEAHNSLGVVRKRQGRLGEAMEEYFAALRLQPGFAEARANLGLLHAAQGRLQDAVLDFEEAVRTKPDYADGHNGLGVLYAQQGRLDEAVREWRTALAINPAHARARANLERALALPGR
jgi:Flp pilus assembly protein TadD